MHVKKYTSYEKCVSKICQLYIEFVARTSQIRIQGIADENEIKNSMIGFWHGDSFGMNFLLREIQGENVKTYVIITKDKRGNYIEYVSSKYGAQPLRMPKGFSLKPFIKELKKVSREQANICIALDGPLGPYKEPKKLGFMLSQESYKPGVLINVQYRRKIMIKKRWDNYVIPMPFGKITFTGHSIGTTTKEQLRDFENYSKKIKKVMNDSY